MAHVEPPSMKKSHLSKKVNKYDNDTIYAHLQAA